MRDLKRTVLPRQDGENQLEKESTGLRRKAGRSGDRDA